jgi:uncharacterized protein YoxC
MLQCLRSHTHTSSMHLPHTLQAVKHHSRSIAALGAETQPVAAAATAALHMSLQFAMLLNKKAERIQTLTDTVQEQARQLEQLQVSVTQLSHRCECVACM